MKICWKESASIIVLFAAVFLNIEVALGDNSDGWTTLGAMPAPTWDGNALLFHSGQGTLAIAPLGDDVVPVRLTAAKSFGRDHSYAVISHDLGASNVKADIGTAATTLTTRTLKVTVQHAPL